MAAVFVYALAKIVSDTTVDYALAKRGKVSPRLERKHGGQAAARRATAGYGLRGYLAASWNDYWPRRAEALKAARDAKAAGSAPRFRDRLRVATGTLRKLVDPVPTKDADGQDPQPTEPEQRTAPPPPALAVDSGDVEPGTVRYTDAGREQWDGEQWRPAPDLPAPSPEDPPAGETPTGETQPDREEAPVTAPTGEAVNYETTLSEIDAMVADTQGRLDSATVVVGKIAEAKAAVDQMQQTYQRSADAARSKLDHESALGLDSTTLGHASDAADALPPNAVSDMFDQLEAVEQVATARVEAEQQALESLEAERAHLVATYGDAHDTVASNLGGDSRFLNSSGPHPTPTGDFANKG